MKAAKWMAGLMLGLGLVACGKTSNGIPPVGPLSADQKARLQATAEALGDATQFKEKALGTSPTTGAVPVSAKRDQVMKAIEEQCLMPSETQTMPPQAKTSGSKVHVATRSKSNDARCPIEFTWDTTTLNKLDDNGALVGRRVEFVMHYVPTNEDAKLAFGAQRYDFNAGIDATTQGAGEVYKGAGRGTAAVVLGGVLQDISLSSQASGTISADSANFTYLYNVVYRDGVFVELKLVMAQAGAGQPMNMTCTLNGETVDPKEFIPYLNKLGFETRLPTQLKN